jgi:hypothetical protein
MSISTPSRVMRLRLGSPPKKFDQRFSTYVPDMKHWLKYEVSRTVDLEDADKSNFKRFEDVDLANKERLILVAANGNRYSVTVDNSGNLGTTEI